MPRQFIEPDNFAYTADQIEVGDRVRGRSETSGNFQGTVTAVDRQSQTVKIDNSLEVEAKPIPIEDRLSGKPHITSVFRNE